VKDSPEIVNFDTWFSIELEGFNSWEIMLLDPVHEVLRSFIF